MSNASDFIADSTQGWASAIVASNNLIADAMGYTALPAAYKTELWTQIDATTSLGHAPTVSAPASQVSDIVSFDYPLATWDASTNTPTLQSSTAATYDTYRVTVAGTTTLDGISSWGLENQAVFKDGTWHSTASTESAQCELTQAEAQECYAVKVAHALWVEKQRTFPWTIVRYNLEQCKGLFDPTYLFWGGWSTSASPYAMFKGASDYDPYGTYQFVTGSLLSGYTHQSTNATVATMLNELSFGGSYPSFHYNTSTPRWGALTPAQHFSAANQINSSHVSRHGCHSGATLWAALARSINIPTKEYHGVLEGGGHHSMAFLTATVPPRAGATPGTDSFYMSSYDNSPEGAVMSHGDWLYNTAFQYANGTRKLLGMGFYEDLIFGQSAATIDLQQIRATNHVYFQEALPYALTLYQAQGWSTFSATYIDPYIPGVVLAAWKAELRQRLKGANGGVEVP